MNERRRGLMSSVKGGLPSEYQQVEWIKSGNDASQNQRIETGIVPTIASKFELTAGFYRQSSVNFFGVRDAASGTDNAFCIASYSSAHKYGFMRWGYGTQTIAFDTNIHTFILSPTEASVNGVMYALTAPKSQTTTKSIWLFQFRDYSNHALEARISRFRFWENGELIADYIPCYRKSDEVIGMYDLVSESFKTNGGYGTFTKGADV